MHFVAGIVYKSDILAREKANPFIFPFFGGLQFNTAFCIVFAKAAICNQAVLADVSGSAHHPDFIELGHQFGYIFE